MTWYLYKRLGHRQHRPWDDHVWTQQEFGHLQDEESGLRRNQICQQLDRGLLVFITVRKETVV